MSVNDQSEAPGGPQFRYRFGKVEVDEVRLELLIHGQLVDVERKPLKVLIELLGHPNEVVTHDELHQSVWEGRPTVRNVLSSAVLKLRKALGEFESCIVNLPGIGYQFSGTVERVAIGRKLASGLALKAGDNVPGREHFVLDLLLGASVATEVWLARHCKTAMPMVYKFDRDGRQLGALKREVTLYRVLRESLGERDDLVRIVDWNFGAAPYYIESEYAGTNLAQWAKSGQPLPSMSVSERIQLFLQIADSVAAAHGVGVLHRDLKPANILVTPRVDSGWQLRVGDFGSGRLVEAGALGQLGITELGLTGPLGVFTDDRSGTPLYVAPEVVAGHAPTVRSDIYALGLILYQLIAGDFATPMASDWQTNIPDQLLREDIADATRGDVTRRIASVEELTHRLRSLDDRRLARQQALETVERAERAERQLERSRARRPLLAAILVCLFLGVATTAWLYRGEVAAHALAQREAARAETIDRFLTEDVIGAADPVAPGQRNGATISEALSRAAQRLDDRFEADPATKGTINLELGRAYFGLADYASAELHERQAVALLSSTEGVSDSRALEAEYVLARTLMLRRSYDEVEAILDQADRNAGNLLQVPSELALLARWTRGGLGFMKNHPEQALPYFEEAERIRMIATPGSDSWLFKVRGNIAWCLNRLNREQDAVTALAELVAPAYTPQRVGILDYAKAHFEYGIALIGLGRYDEAVTITQAALDQTEQALGQNHFMTAILLNHLSAALGARGDWDAASMASARAYGIICAIQGKQSRAALGTYANIGALKVLAGDNEGGLSALSEARAGLVAIVGATDPLVEDVDYYMAYALNSTGKPKEAEATLESLHAFDLNSVEPGCDWEARLDGLRGLIALNLGNETEARNQLRIAVDRMNQRPVPAWLIKPLERALGKLDTNEKRKSAGILARRRRPTYG